MRTSKLPAWGAAAFAVALSLGGCNAAASHLINPVPGSSAGSVSSSGKRSLVFAESTVEAAAGHRWVGTGGVEIDGFEDRQRSGVAFTAPAGGRVRAGASALPSFSRATEAKVRIAVANATADRPVHVEFSFHDDAHRNRWFKSVTFEDAGWKTVTLRLPLLQADRGIAPEWDDVSSWGMTFRDDAEVRVQTFELWDDGGPTSPRAGLEMLGFAFGEPPSIRAGQALASLWYGDEPLVRLDTAFDDTVDGFLALHRRARQRFPALPDPEQEVPLLVLSSQTAFRSLWNMTSSSGSSRPKGSASRYDWLGFVAPDRLAANLRASGEQPESAPAEYAGWTAAAWAVAEQASSPDADCQ